MREDDFRELVASIEEAGDIRIGNKGDGVPTGRLAPC